MTAMPSMYGHLDASPEQGAPPSSMLERVTLIIDLFDVPNRRLALEEVCRRTGLPRSSAHRILEHMTSLGWVSRSEAGYGLGSRARWLGRLAGDSTALRSVSAPLLHELAIVTGLVAHLGILEGAEVFYLDKVGGRSAGECPSRVGGRAPAHRTALGMAMLAFLAPEQVDIHVAPFLDRDDRGQTLVDLHRDLDRIRNRNGLAVERGAHFPGIGSVAVGLPGPEGPVGAISLVGRADVPFERIAPLVARAAARINQQLLRLPSTALNPVRVTGAETPIRRVLAVV